MDAMEAILTTRAMRRYSDAPVPDELLMRCLEAAQQAPLVGTSSLSSTLSSDLMKCAMRSLTFTVGRLSATKCLPEPVFRSEQDRLTYERTRKASQILRRQSMFRFMCCFCSRSSRGGFMMKRVLSTLGASTAASTRRCRTSVSLREASASEQRSPPSSGYIRLRHLRS